MSNSRSVKKALDIESEDLGSSPRFSLYKLYAWGNNGVKSLYNVCKNQISKSVRYKVWSAKQILGIFIII